MPTSLKEKDKLDCIHIIGTICCAVATVVLSAFLWRATDKIAKVDRQMVEFTEDYGHVTKHMLLIQEVLSAHQIKKMGVEIVTFDLKFEKKFENSRLKYSDFKITNIKNNLGLDLRNTDWEIEAGFKMPEQDEICYESLGKTKPCDIFGNRHEDVLFDKSQTEEWNTYLENLIKEKYPKGKLQEFRVTAYLGLESGVARLPAQQRSFQLHIK